MRNHSESKPVVQSSPFNANQRATSNSKTRQVNRGTATFGVSSQGIAEQVAKSRKKQQGNLSWGNKLSPEFQKMIDQSQEKGKHEHKQERKKEEERNERQRGANNDCLSPKNSISKVQAQEKIKEQERQQRASQLSRLYDPHRRNEDYYNSKLPEGLPNLGNTCFLNSILQFLYGAVKFREMLIQISKAKTADNSCECGILVGKIFSCLKEKGRHDQKSRFLKQLMGNLERINMFYKMYQQEDALETILNLLNSINDSLRNKAVYKLFAVDVGLKCKCLPYECKSQSLYISLQNETCTKCSQLIVKRYLTFPDCIITNNNGDSKQGKANLDGQCYELASQVMYMGTGKSGHYTCLRIENGEVFEFNDSRVTQVERNQLLAQSKPQESYFTHPKRPVYAEKSKIFLYVKASSKTKATLNNFKGTQPSKRSPSNQKPSFRSEPRSQQESTSYGKAALPKNKISKLQLMNDIDLNQVYATKINAVGQIYPTKLGYKPRHLVFQLVGSHNNFSLRILNEFNYFYLENNIKDLENFIQRQIYDHQHSFNLNRLIQIIEERIAEHAKRAIHSLKGDRKLHMKFMKQDDEREGLSAESLLKEARNVNYTQSLKG